MEAYQYPQYYAIALAPSDPGREIDFFEAAIDRFSKVKVNRVFELGAGTAPYMEEWHKRGYAYCGLDLSPAMIEFGREKARRLGIEDALILGDMRDLDRGLGPFDLAYVLLHNRAGGPEHAARALLHGGLSDALGPLQSTFLEIRERYRNASDIGPRSYAEQAVQVDPQTPEAELRADAVDAVQRFFTALGFTAAP